MIRSFIAQNIYEPLYARLYKRDDRVELFHYYKRAQWNSLKDNRKIQAKRLFDLLKYATENIPFYMRYVKKNKIVLSEETIFDDIKKFPIMTKDMLRLNFKDVHKKIPERRWYYNTSGGSTGEPVKFIQDDMYQAHSNAMTRLQFNWAGYNLGDSQIKLWGSQKDILDEKDSIAHRFAEWMKGIHILNSFYMDEEKMRSYADTINKRRPRIILAYAQSMNELAKFIKKSNVKVYSPYSIMTSAGILYPDFRKNIEQTFDCPVFDRYGSREVGNLACECEKHEGLHASILTHYYEILNDSMKPCKKGELGHIYVTTLMNYTMPLIRYKIGDMACEALKECSCKRGFPLLKDVAGRDTDVFKTRDGKLIQGEFFIHFIGVIYNKGEISKFQVIQKDYDKIEIKVVTKDKTMFDKMKHKIVGSIHKVMGKECRVKFIIVKDIKPTASGKYRYTIREF